MSRLLRISLAAIAVSAALPVYAQTVTITTAGGDYGNAIKEAMWAPAAKELGYDVREETQSDGLAALKMQVTSGAITTDIIHLGSPEGAQAAAQSLLEPLDYKIIDANSVPAGAKSDYCYPFDSYGTVMSWNTKTYGDKGPQSWADFWDVKKFPGPRCLYDRSFSCLAFAMLADGVRPDKLYPMDIDHAFRKMSELKPHIKTWWREGSQSQQLIRDGEVDMIAMWSARGVDLIEDKVPLELVWNGAETYYANLLVPKGNPRAKLAWEFCNFVAQAKPQAEFAMLLPYGPANPGARALMTEARLKQTPAWPDNEKVSFQHDAAWIAPRLAQIRERWTRWLTS